MPDGYLMGGVSSELAPIWAQKNGATGYSEGAPSPVTSKTHVLAMSDGTLLCSSESSAEPGVWRPDGLGRTMLAETGYQYNNMVEVPGGCVIGSGRAKAPVYYYDSASDTLTDLKITSADTAWPELAIPYDGGIWLIIYRENVYDIGRLDTTARTYTRLGNFGGFSPKLCARTAAGVVLTGSDYIGSSWYSAVWQMHTQKGLGSKYEAVSISNLWQPIGYVGGKLLLSCGRSGTGAALLDVSANGLSQYGGLGTFDRIFGALAETRDYIWAGHYKGICRISKATGALEIAADAGSTASYEDMDTYSAHEVDGGWLILPRNSDGRMICYLQRDTQTIYTLLSGVRGGGSYASDVWRLPDGKYVAKQRCADPLYLCNIDAKAARALPGTDAYSRALYLGGTQLIAARDDTHRVVWYDAASETQTHEGGGYDGDILLMLRAPDARYVVLISRDSIVAADTDSHTSVCLYDFPTLDEARVDKIYRRGKWLIILRETNWESEYASSYVYMLDMRAWRVYTASDGRAGSLPYGERECETLYG